MKSVLISIRPNWCEKIANGKKTIEVRKTKPELQPPFKCYIYCTQSKEGLPDCAEMYIHSSGKVIGEFICDRISEAHWMQDLGYACIYKTWQDNEDCITNDKLLEYMGKKDVLYGWHISDLKIYNEPKELSEFIKPCPTPFQCDKCNDLVEHFGCGLTITRPPQSWCYVEEMEE